MIVIRVYGIPGPQGSKRHVGRGVMIESSKKVKPWRQAVAWAAVVARSRMREDGKKDMVTGPVRLWIEFVLPRPKRSKLKAQAGKRPDLSKLVRSTEDALTDAGAWTDDARVVWCQASKVYGEEPGALIRIMEAGNANS